MTSVGSSRLTGFERVTWLGNADSRIYATNYMFSILHAEKW